MTRWLDDATLAGKDAIDTTQRSAGAGPAVSAAIIA
jgi:hypothetical protein